MINKDNIHSEHIQQSYIKLLEESNVDLHKKTNPFSSKNILVYSGLFLFIASIVVAFLGYSNSSSTDIFKDQLVATHYNTNQILLETQSGVFYQITNNTDKKWMATDGVFVTVTNKTLSLTTTVPLAKDRIAYYSLWIPDNKTYTVISPDGTKVLLNSNSKLTFSNSRNTSKTHAILEGEAYFDVAHNPDKPYLIRASEMNIEVFGTSFNVNNKNPKDKTSLALVKGSVRIRKNNNESVFIKPGEEAVLKEKQLLISSANFAKILSWTSNQLYFSDETLGSITQKIGAWYNVDFIIKNPTLRNLRFTGSSHKEDGLIHFLQKLQYTEGIHYQITNNKIILDKKANNN